MNKKHLLLSLALCLMMPLSALAQLTAGDYYLQNVGSGLWLNFASTSGTTAVLADNPHRVTLTRISDGVFTIGTETTSGGFLNASGSSVGSSTNFTFTEVSSGIYTIQSSAGYMAQDGTTLAAGESGKSGAWYDVTMNSTLTNEYAQWKVKSLDDILADMASATETNPVNCTAFIRAANHNRRDGELSTTNWASYNSANVGFCSGFEHNWCAHFFNKAFDWQQTLNGLPAGKYELRVQGFYRYGANGDGTADWTANAATGGTPGAYLYAGNDQIPLKSIYSEAVSDASFYTGSDFLRTTSNIGTYPYVSTNNETNTSAYKNPCKAFDNGMYRNTLSFQKTDDNPLNIGVRSSLVKTYEWTAFDNFELYYYGPLLDLTPYKELYYALRTKIQNDIIGQTSVYTDDEDGATAVYNDVLATQNDIVENATTEQEIADARTALWAAALTFMKSVTISGTGFDLTNFMVNPEMVPSSATTAEGWTYSKNLVFDDYQITQFPGSSDDPHFDIHQVVADMPAGQYTLKARGFYRPGSFSSSDMTSVANTEVLTYIYLNETQQALVNICADGSPTQLSKGASTKVNGTTIYIPNSRSHLDPFFAANYYWNEMAAITNEDGDLTIGLKYDTWVSGGWGVISDFHLYYRGPLDLSAWQEQLALTVSAAQALEIPTLPRRQLTEVVQQNNKTYTTAEDYQTAIANINAAIAVAEPYVEPYAQYKTMRTMIQERFIDQASVYTDPDNAADAYNTSLSTINSAVDNVNSVDALETQKTNLWNAALTFMKGVSINEGMGFDLTWMIGDADFSDSNYKSYWTEVLASSTTVGVTSGVMRYYNSSFDLSQTLPYTLPAGAYRMKVDGFERTNDPMNTAWSDYQAGNSIVTGTLYLNNNEQLIMNLFEVQNVTSSSLGGAKPDGASFYVPNGSSAANNYLQAGHYPNTLIGVLATDAAVTLGYRCANTKAWTAVDNFQLEYIGEAPQVALNVTEGELIPVYAPFVLDVSDANVTELYAVGGVYEGHAKLYAVNTVPAGTPCVAKFSTSSYSAPMEMTLASGKKFVLPWYDGVLVSNADDNTWTYTGEGTTTVSIDQFDILDYNNMQFAVNLENYAARQYLSKVEYSGSSDPSEVAQYNVAPPARRDIPNAVMIPVPAFSEGEATLTVTDDDNHEVATQTLTAGQTEAYVYNLLPQRSYTFTEMMNSNTISEGQFQTTGHLRMVYAPSAYNIRDLGGWQTQDGHRTTYGHLFRGSTLNGYVNCTAEDLQTLRDLGVGGEIDLRYKESYDKDMGCGTSAFGFTDDDYYFAAANDYTAANLSEAATQARLKQEFDFILDHFRAGKAVYFHCAWGADRTGMLSFLLEGVLGLTLDQIYKNYELTSFSAAPGNTNRVKTSFQDRIDVIQALSGETLRDKFENYFVNSLGVSMDDITYFRSVMLDVYPFSIDEDADVPAYYNGKADVTLHRTLKADKHNTVVFPFNLPLWKAQYFFGNDATMERITAYAESLQTETIDEAPANTPFLLIPSAVRADNTYHLDAVTMVEGELAEAAFTNGKMVGTYTAIDVAKSETAGKENYVISNDKFYVIGSSAAPMKSTRAYLVLDTPSDGVKSIVTFEGDEATGIETLFTTDSSRFTVYDLSGRRVAQPTKGLYIVNGKKVWVK